MTACARCDTPGVLLNSGSGWCQLCMESTVGVLQQRISTALDIPLKLLTGPSPDGLPGHWSLCLPDSGIPNHEQENRMQRVLRWDVPVDDGWHEIGAGPVVHVAARSYRERHGDLVEVWTLEETPSTFIDADGIPRRSVSVYGTGNRLPDDVYHLGTAVVPALRVISGPTRETVEGVESMAGLVWHVFAKHDTETDRQALAEEGRRLASVREDLIAQGVDPNELPVPLHPDPLPPLGTEVHGIVRCCKVQTLDDEATSLAYWLAKELGEHVDDQDGETLTQTVRRLIANRLTDAHRRRTDGAPHIGGFQRGHIVTIGTNGDTFEGETGVVATLDHDHGWRLWVRVGRDVHDMHAPALYLSPDDIDMVVIS